MKTNQKAFEVLKRLKKEYPTAGPFTKWSNVFELTIVTVLSAQCTDERVNIVSPELFKVYKNPQDLAGADPRDIERIIYSTGFFRSKAKYLKGIGTVVMERFEGKIPGSFEDLMQLPGVSKKSACIILAKGFNVSHGVAVDTHVLRVAPRIGLTRGKAATSVSKDLEKLYPKSEYLHVNEYLITHGRAVCKPRKPACSRCILADICSSFGKYSSL